MVDLPLCRQGHILGRHGGGDLPIPAGKGVACFGRVGRGGNGRAVVLLNDDILPAVFRLKSDGVLVDLPLCRQGQIGGHGGLKVPFAFAVVPADEGIALFSGVGRLVGRGVGTNLGCYFASTLRLEGDRIGPDDFPVKGAAGNSARRFFRSACVVDICYLSIKNTAGDGAERTTALVGHFATKGTVCDGTAVHHRAGKLAAGDDAIIPHQAGKGTAADGPPIRHGAIECSADDLGGTIVRIAAADGHGVALLTRRAAAYRYIIPDGQIADAVKAAAGVFMVYMALDRAAIPDGSRTGEDGRAEIAETAAAGIVIIRGLCHAAGNGPGRHLEPAAIFHMNTAALARRAAHDIAAPHEERAAFPHIDTAAAGISCFSCAGAAGEGAALYLYDIFFGGGFICQLPQGVALIELVNGIGIAVDQRQLSILGDMDQVADPAGCFQ